MSPPLIDCVADAPALLGESPLWHPVEQVLYFCDIPARTVRRWDPAAGRGRQWVLDSEVGSLAPVEGDAGLLLACRDGLWRFDPASGRRHLLIPPPYDPRQQRFNDGKCGPDARFWVGTLDDARRPLAALYAFDGRTLERQADGITTSNGLAWSPDANTLYWSDTRAHTIFALDVDRHTGALGERRVFARFEDKASCAPRVYGGRPDGAAMDAEGHYWVAMFEGARLLRFAPTGELSGEVPLPVQCPTMPCFGDADLKTLYITTARQNRPDEELARQPWAGHVLRLRVDVPGLPANGLRPRI